LIATGRFRDTIESMDDEIVPVVKVLLDGEETEFAGDVAIIELNKRNVRKALIP
jgi:hypothetical protein